MSASATDRTVNKVALCSAIFAGCAYVGYSVVRQAFGRQLIPGVHVRGGRRGKSKLKKRKSFRTVRVLNRVKVYIMRVLHSSLAILL